MTERFTAQMYIDMVAEQKGVSVKDFGVAPVVVASWSKSTIQAFVTAVDAKIPKQWIYKDYYPLYTGLVDDVKVSFVNLPVGSAGTVMIMEELVACGARMFIGRGWAGSLQSSVPIGSFFIPTSCIREEGTSMHYLSRNVDVRPSPHLLELLQRCCKSEGIKVKMGPIWTTDAPYRETMLKIKRYMKKGIVGVDMETSAMYSLGKARSVEVCNLLIISDEVWGEWQPAFGSEKVKQAEYQALKVLLRCLGEFQEEESP